MKQPNPKGRGFFNISIIRLCLEISFRFSAVRLVILFMLVLITTSSLIGCSRTPSVKPYLVKDRDSRWVNDLTYLEKTLPQVHKNLYFHLTEEEFQRQLEELRNKIPDYTDEQIEIELSVILAGIGDTHTGSSIGSEFRYPLELHWFTEGIYIIGTNKENEELLDAKIINLNGKKIEEAVNMLRPVLAEANESWFKTQIIYYLPIPGVLQYFGLSTSDVIELDVELQGGQVQTKKLKPISYKEYVAVERINQRVPLYRSRPDVNYWYEYLEEERVIYLNYNSCRQMRDKPFEIFAKEFWDFVQSHDVDKLILDIRDNRGGSSRILEPFIKEVKKSSFNQSGKLYVVIGRDTFSSAILNALRLKQETNAYFVGEAAGGEPNHYGEVKQFKLPNSEKPIRYSTKYFHWSDQDINTLEPDKVINETFTAYREGTDPVLEWIVKQN